MTIIFSYNRPKMLSRLLDEVTGVVIDDGSDYDPKPFLNRCEYHRLPHGGKEYFWNTWNYALSMCKESDDDFFLFLPDDVYNVDLERIKWIHSRISKPYAFNVLNVGHETGWTGVTPKQTEIDGYKAIKCGFVDCGYFCNRQALEKMNFSVDWVNPLRFKQKGISSGVGQHQSRILWKKGVDMYLPCTSLAHHGDHESEMHPNERKLNPLVSI